MTPKEKAINIVDKMYSKASFDEGMGYLEAIECAFVCVDEILNALANDYIIYGSEYRYEVSAFYVKVKEEIEKL